MKKSNQERPKFTLKSREGKSPKKKGETFKQMLKINCRKNAVCTIHHHLQAQFSKCEFKVEIKPK